MRVILLIFLLVQLCYGQNPNFVFNTRPYDAIDRWVVLNKTEKNPNYTLGFVYIDPQVGFRLNYHGQIELVNNEIKLLPRLDSGEMKMSLDRETADLALLSDKHINQLDLPIKPSWLADYKLNEDFTSYKLGIGSALNAMGASHKALPILQQAYKEDMHYPGLEFELAYAYNASGSHYKAVIILNNAIENDPSNFWYYRELGFAYKHLDNLPEAEKTYLKGIELASDNFQKAEMAINMVQSYFHIQDRIKFDEWKKIVLSYAEPSSDFFEYIKYFEDNWGK